MLLDEGQVADLVLFNTLAAVEVVVDELVKGTVFVKRVECLVDGLECARVFLLQADAVVLVGELLAVLLQLDYLEVCLLYTSPSPRDRTRSRMPSSA